MDLIMLKPILNKKKIYEKFLIENKWAKNYVATGYNKKISNNLRHLTSNSIKNNYWDKLVNWMAFWLQFWYMKKKITTEEVNLHQAFFYK